MSKNDIFQTVPYEPKRVDPKAALEKFITAMNNGQKIAAIKAARDLTSCNLQEAKHLVENNPLVGKRSDIRAHTFSTSLGEVEILTRKGKTLVYGGSENISHFDWYEVSLDEDKEGNPWVNLHLEDGAYGAPEFPCKPSSVTEEKMNWFHAELLALKEAEREALKDGPIVIHHPCK